MHLSKLNVAFAAVILAATAVGGGGVADDAPAPAAGRFGPTAFRDGDGELAAVAFSPDGKTLAASGSDVIYLWDAATGAVRRKIEGKQGRVQFLAFSADGKILASSRHADTVVQLWDAETGKELRQLGADIGGMYNIHFSADGKYLFALGDKVGEKKNIVQWEVASGKELRRFPTRDAVFSIAGSPDGLYLATAGNDLTAFREVRPAGIVRVIDLDSGKEACHFHPGDLGGIVTCRRVAFAPDSKTIAAVGGGSGFGIWDAATGKLIRQVGNYPYPFTSVFFAPDGKTLATVGNDRQLRLWDVETLKPLYRMAVPQQGERLISFSPDGKTLAAPGSKGTIHLWETATGKSCVRGLPDGTNTGLTPESAKDPSVAPKSQ